jgi:putative long chain acyl-CoA synthase
MLNELVDAPLQPGERHHGLRLFIGSGMPTALWRRVEKRFSPARVLEFYAATESSAVLVNVSAAKLGSMGRPLPGSAQVRLAAYDIGAGRYVLGRDGFVIACGPGEIGMLLARARSGEETSATELRGVFARGDAWLETGDLFRRDADGDYWRVDSLADVIRAKYGPVFTGPIRDALGTIPAVELAVAYGVVPAGREHPLAIAAVTLRPDGRLRPRDLGTALRLLPRDERPQLVHVVDRIPVTTWFRPLTGSLREAGIPEPGNGGPAWYLDARSENYKPLTAAAYRRLSGIRARTSARR